MKTFDVYDHPEYGAEALKHGFSWPAFFWTVLWALKWRLWVHALLFSLAIVILRQLEAYISPLCYWVYGGIGALAGFKANEWVSKRLTQRGYKLVKKVQASAPSDAVYKAFHEEEPSPPETSIQC